MVVVAPIAQDRRRREAGLPAQQPQPEADVLEDLLQCGAGVDHPPPGLQRPWPHVRRLGHRTPAAASATRAGRRGTVGFQRDDRQQFQRTIDGQQRDVDHRSGRIWRRCASMPFEGAPAARSQRGEPPSHPPFVDVDRVEGLRVPGHHILVLVVQRIRAASRNCMKPGTPPTSSGGQRSALGADAATGIVDRVETVVQRPDVGQARVPPHSCASSSCALASRRDAQYCASARRRPCAARRSSRASACGPPWPPSSCRARHPAERDPRLPRSRAVWQRAGSAASAPRRATLPGFRSSTSFTPPDAAETERVRPIPLAPDASGRCCNRSAERTSSRSRR